MLTIEHPLTGEKLQVANKDFSVQMNWPEAKNACESLGNGWRLPTLEELEEMHRQLRNNGLGAFKTEYYWSGTYNDPNSPFYVGFEEGDVYGYGENYYTKEEEMWVRAVRALL